MRALISVGAAVFAASSVTAQVPRAISADPPRDSVHPARMEVLHIPSGGVNINGVAYIASGPGAHPAFIFFHGLPGNEKNLDLAQAVRRAGGMQSPSTIAALGAVPASSVSVALSRMLKRCWHSCPIPRMRAGSGLTRGG